MAILNLNPQHKLAGLILSVSLLGVSTLATSATFGNQSSNRASEWGFDFVEEFDGLQDWDQSSCRNGTSPCGDRYDTINPERMPKLGNGSQSAWGYFSVWNTAPAPAPWIGSETASGRKVWRGNKSLTIDIGSTNYGPSRLGVFMAEGYTHWSAFYMAWLPKNMFPTSCVGGSCSGGGPLGIYEDGKPYTYFASYKFNDLVMGCPSSNCPGYGEHPFVNQIRQRNYDPKGLTIDFDPRGTEIWPSIDAGKSLNHLMGDWFGFEISVENTNNNTQSRVNIWVYDKNGNAMHVLRDKVTTLPSNAYNSTWNQFVFGGNNANSWTWGPTMQSHYYVDDFIVDHGSKGRIGPRYFNLIGTLKTAAPPSPPGNATAIPNM